MGLKGHCLCKAVTYTVDVDQPLLTGYDHCDDCQRQSGSTYCMPFSYSSHSPLPRNAAPCLWQLCFSISRILLQFLLRSPMASPSSGSYFGLEFRYWQSKIISPSYCRPQGQAYPQWPRQEVEGHRQLRKSCLAPILLRVWLAHRPRPWRCARDYCAQGWHAGYWPQEEAQAGEHNTPPSSPHLKNPGLHFLDRVGAINILLTVYIFINRILRSGPSASCLFARST